MIRAALLCPLLLLAACEAAPPVPKPDRPDARFPDAHRPVSGIVSSQFSTEEARDRVREATRVMDLSAIRPGMTVADIGAGEGYYTVRLAARVGPDGRVLAEDIQADVRDRLAERVARDSLDNVSVRLGEPTDPKLPSGSFDRVLMIHMYHEIASPYEFLWNLRPALKPGGRVVVVDADRPTDRHGTPPALLDCEFAAVGYLPVERHAIPSADAYLTLYAAKGDRPAPETIKACAG